MNHNILLVIINRSILGVQTRNVTQKLHLLKHRREKVDIRLYWSKYKVKVVGKQYTYSNHYNASLESETCRKICQRKIQTFNKKLFTHLRITMIRKVKFRQFYIRSRFSRTNLGMQSSCMCIPE